MKTLKLIILFLSFTVIGWSQAAVSIPGTAGQNGQGGVHIGDYAGQNTTMANNVIVGTYAGQQNISGGRNVYLGYQAGRNNNGGYNVFIGNMAASLQTGVMHKLYIENSNEADTPLIYGDFSSDKVGINTSSVPSEYTLAINGKTITEEVQVMLSTEWPDYVFADDYNLMPLTDLETEIETLGHLPGVPSAEEVEKNGHALGNMDAILLEKVEELTLHLIEMNKEMEELREKNEELDSTETTSLEKIEELTQSLKEMSEEVEELRTENEVLETRLSEVEDK